MPPSLSTFLAYQDKNYTNGDREPFVNKILDYLELKYPDLNFSIFQHVYAPECYISKSVKEQDIKHLGLLKSKSRNKFSEFGEFLKSNELLILPLTDHTNQVKYLFIISCFENIIEDLSGVARQIKEVFRIVSSQIEEGSRSINLKTANLISRISHDLNSLIALIPREMVKDEDFNARIKYLDILSREIMFYLRDINVDKIQVSIQDLFKGITSLITIPNNVTFNLRFTVTFDSLSVDVDLIDRAISEIMMNAVMAASIDGGKVEMTVGKRMNISPFIKYDWLEVTISDTGPGIAREYIEEIRNPLFTTRKEQGHVGLGLSIAEKIIQAHDGHLDIKSSREKGTVVKIHLPLN